MTELRLGIAVLARSDRRQLSATLKSIAQLSDRLDAVLLVVPQAQGHAFASVLAEQAIKCAACTILADASDRLPLASGFRKLAQTVDIIVFVPEGVLLSAAGLGQIRADAENWQDLVGEILSIDGVVDGDGMSWHWKRSGMRPFRAKTLCDHMLWLRVAACGGLKMAELPAASEYLTFAAALAALRRRGRTRATWSSLATRIRFGPERRSGSDAGYALYAALERIAQLRRQGDAAFELNASYLKPRAEQIRLFCELAARYLANPAARPHSASFLKGMLQARRDAGASRRRIRRDIRELG